MVSFKSRVRRGPFHMETVSSLNTVCVMNYWWSRRSHTFCVIHSSLPLSASFFSLSLHHMLEIIPLETFDFYVFIYLFMCLYKS